MYTLPQTSARVNSATHTTSLENCLVSQTSLWVNLHKPPQDWNPQPHTTRSKLKSQTFILTQT